MTYLNQVRQQCVFLAARPRPTGREHWPWWAKAALPSFCGRRTAEHCSRAMSRDGFANCSSPDTPPCAGARPRRASADAVSQSAAIETAIDHAQSDVELKIVEGTYRETIEDGVAAWDQLKRDTGFDLRGVFRRRQLIPFVFLPRRVSWNCPKTLNAQEPTTGPRGHSSLEHLSPVWP